MNTLQALKQANNIFQIDIVISCESKRKSYARPIIKCPTYGVETQKPIFGTANEMNDILCHFRNLGYRIKKNYGKTLQGDTCYSIFNRRKPL